LWIGYWPAHYELVSGGTWILEDRSGEILGTFTADILYLTEKVKQKTIWHDICTYSG